MTTEQRLERVERDLSAAKRRNNQLLGGVALVILAFLSVAAMPGDKEVVRAQQFIVVDKQGRECAMLKAIGAPIEGPFLALMHSGGKAILGVDKNGPSLHMVDKNGEIGAALIVGENGPGLDLFDEKGRSCANLTVPKGGPRLAFYDENGGTRAGMGLFKAGPEVSLFDENGKRVWSAP